MRKRYRRVEGDDDYELLNPYFSHDGPARFHGLLYLQDTSYDMEQRQDIPNDAYHALFIAFRSGIILDVHNCPSNESSLGMWYQ